MSGYNFVLQLRRFEKEIDRLGFRMAYPKTGSREYDCISLMPKDEDSLPVYSRDAELFVGTIAQAEEWIRGIEWARTYDTLLKISDSKKREKHEQSVRNRKLVNTIAGGSSDYPPASYLPLP